MTVEWMDGRRVRSFEKRVYHDKMYPRSARAMRLYILYTLFVSFCGTHHIYASVLTVHSKGLPLVHHQ